MTALPLTGIRVTDFTWIGAGSYTTKMLADMGAEVLKIESSTYPDSLRLSAPFKDGKAGINRSGYFADRNTSKQSITINLKNPEGVALVRRLIADSDVVANNFTPGTMEKLGLGYQDVVPFNPGVIYVSMSTQGATGPERNTVGYGLTIGAMTGLQYLTGLPGREPVGTGTNYPDHVPNPGHAAFAILVALRHRRRTGQGQYIDIAQTEPTIAVLAPALLRQAANQENTEAQGNRSAEEAPHGVYPCVGTDRWIAISVRTDAEWPALLRVLNVDTLANPDWLRFANRKHDEDDLDDRLAAITRSWNAEELMHALQSEGVPAALVATAEDVIKHDPQLAHRHHWRCLEHQEMGAMLYNGLPFTFASTTLGPFRPAPLLGEHTRDICRTILGLEDAEIDRLIDARVLQ